MNRKNCCLVALGSAMLFGASSASADLEYAFHSDTGGGDSAVFGWDGGNADGYGEGGTLYAAMRYAAAELGGSNFTGSGFQTNGVNIFMVDFRHKSAYRGAGLTMFVMWGNGEAVDDFAGTISASPTVREGIDGRYTPGLPQVYALGPGVDIASIGPLTIDVNVDGGETPVGYAVTNMQALPGRRFNQNFTLVQSVRAMGLFSMGSGQVWTGVDDDGDDRIFTDGIVVQIIPAPGAMALLGLGLVTARRRRRG